MKFLKTQAYKRFLPKTAIKWNYRHRDKRHQEYVINIVSLTIFFKGADKG